MVEEAKAMGPEATGLREEAPGWAKADRAAGLERRADALELAATQTLFAAPIHALDLPEAHAALVEHYQQEHAAAEAARQPEATARNETLLRAHTAALRESHETRRRCAAWLKGTGALSLVTDPPGPP